MSVKLESTTDSPETVTAAIGGLVKKEEKAVEKKSASEADIAEDESKEETESSEESESQNEVSDEDEAIEEQQEESKDESRKPKKGFKKKIDRLAKENSHKDLIISAKDQEIEHWKAQALKGQEKSNVQGKSSKAEQSTEASTKPKAPKPVDFETHEEFLEAQDAYVDKLTDWKLEQQEAKKAKAAKETEVKSQYEKQREAFAQKTNEYRKSIPDFDDVVSEVDDIPPSPAVHDAILTSENGPQLVYELAKNRAEYERINALSPIAAARELGKFEARFIKDSSQKTVKTTKAPAPISPVGKGTGSVGKKSIYDPNLSQKEYEKLREESMRGA